MTMQSRLPGGSAPDDAAWHRILARDKGARFLFSVDTTGVYCLPSCPARRPRREHVRLFPDPARAKAAGFRACLRCRPDAPLRSLVERASELLQGQASERIRVETVAARLGVSPEHLHREFRRHLGVTPRQFLQAIRRRLVQGSLRDGETVSRSANRAGHGSISRLYGPSALGMAPRAYRAGGERETIAFATAASDLGWILAASTRRGVCAVRLGESPRELEGELQREFPRAEIRAAQEGLKPLLEEVVRLASGGVRGAGLPLDLRGSAFQVRVWNELARVPRGATRSYAEVAAALGMPAGARAVARACATNPLALLIPCHRIVGADGSLRGYRWGLDRKRRLLRLERGDPL